MIISFHIYGYKEVQLDMVNFNLHRLICVLSALCGIIKLFPLNRSLRVLLRVENPFLCYVLITKQLQYSYILCLTNINYGSNMLYSRVKQWQLTRIIFLVLGVRIPPLLPEGMTGFDRVEKYVHVCVQYVSPWKGVQFPPSPPSNYMEVII